MAFAAGNKVRHLGGGCVCTVSSVTSNSDGSQNVTCVDGHGRSMGTFNSRTIMMEPTRGGGAATAIAPSTIVRYTN